LQTDRDTVDAGERAVSDTDIDCAAGEMEAVGRDTLGRRAQHRVGRRRAVARDYLEGLAAPEAPMEPREEIEEIAVDRINILGAEIAQQIIDPVRRIGEIASVRPIGEVERLPGVEMMKS